MKDDAWACLFGILTGSALILGIVGIGCGNAGNTSGFIFCWLLSSVWFGCMGVARGRAVMERKARRHENV